MTIPDSVVIGGFVSLCASIGAAARYLWIHIYNKLESNANCERRLARIQGVLFIMAKYEQREEVRAALLSAVGPLEGEHATDLEFAMTTGRRTKMPKRRKTEETPDA